MVIVVGRLAVPQLVADSCRVSIAWMAYWVGCVGGEVCCSSVVLCELGLAVGTLSIRCGEGCTDLLDESELRPSDVSSATGIGGMVLT